MEYRVSLKAARINADLLQSDVAKRLGVSKESVANWERGKTAPRSTTLVRLCQMYNVPINAIILPKKFDKNEQNKMQFQETG